MRPGDVVIVNTGWHHKYRDSEEYFCKCPGFVPSAGDWFVEKKVKVVGHDTQANDHPLATAIGPHRNGPLHPHLAEEFKKWSGGVDWKEAHPEWEPVHRKLFTNGILGIENVGGDLDAVTGKRVTFAFFPWNWDRGDGCIIRLVAMIDKSQNYRIENGEVRFGEVACQSAEAELQEETAMLVKRFADAKPYEAPQPSRRRRAAAAGFRAGRPDQSMGRIVAISSRRRRRSGFDAVREGLCRARRPNDGHRRRQGDRALGPMDSCTIAPSEVREIVNRDNDVCKMLVVIPYPPGAKP